jgi:hypothetical protein
MGDIPHDPADVIDREAAAAWGGAASASHEKPRTGANTMRSLLALGLLIAVCTSAAAAHSRPRHHHGYSSYGSYSRYGSYGGPSPYNSYGSYGGSYGSGYGDYSGGYGGGFSGHNSSQWGGQPD